MSSHRIHNKWLTVLKKCCYFSKRVYFEIHDGHRYLDLVIYGDILYLFFKITVCELTILARNIMFLKRL